MRETLAVTLATKKDQGDDEQMKFAYAHHLMAINRRSRGLGLSETLRDELLEELDPIARHSCWGVGVALQELADGQSVTSVRTLWTLWDLEEEEIEAQLDMDPESYESLPDWDPDELERTADLSAEIEEWQDEDGSAASDSLGRVDRKAQGQEVVVMSFTPTRHEALCLAIVRG